jgi:hypothetical protein
VVVADPADGGRVRKFVVDEAALRDDLGAEAAHRCIFTVIEIRASDRRIRTTEGMDS